MERLATMDREEIEQRLKYGERINLECKKAESTLPNSVWETYSSFANTEGGLILFGVEEHVKVMDSEKRFSYVSINNPEQRLKDFWNTINSSKVSSNILVDANVGICELHGAQIMWIEVPQADYKNKPVYINENPLKGTFKRNYEGDYHCTEDEVKAMCMIGYGDNIGSGFPAILSAWGDENWRKPDLSQNEELHQVELKLWMISLMPAECTEHLHRLLGTAYDHLDREAQLILGTAYLEGRVTNVRMQSMLDLNSTDIGHVLAELVEKNMLIADKKGRWTSYSLNEEYKIEPEQIDLGDIPIQECEFKNESDRIIYEYIKVNRFITTKQTVDITRITTTAGASVALGRLIKAGPVRKVRKGKQVIYTLNE